MAQSLLIAIPFAPLNLWPLALVSVAPMIWLATRCTWSTRRIALAVAIATAPAWLMVQLWMLEVTALGLPVFVLILSAWSATEFAAIRWLHIRRPNWPLWIIAPIAIVSVEWLRGVIVLDGYPWFAHGIPLLEWPLFAQCIDLAGVAILSAIVAATSGCAVVLLAQRNNASSARGAMVAVMAILCFVLSYGAWRMSESTIGRTVRVLVVQTDLATSNKLRWEPEQQVSDADHWASITVEAFAAAKSKKDSPVQLIVWPETSLPGFGLEPSTLERLRAGEYWPGDRFAQLVGMIAQVTDTPLVVGSHCAVGLRAENQRWHFDESFNSAYLVAPNGEIDRYDKVFLTPFGETMPIISKWSWLESQLLALGAEGMSFDLDAGTQFNPLVVPVQGAPLGIATPICFEDTMGWVVRRLVWNNGTRQAEVIVNLSNDGWFGSSDAGRVHHAQMARARSIENRTPLIRCANTGVSCAFDSCGRLTHTMPPRTESAEVMTVTTDTRVSLFARFGDVASPTAMVLFLLSIIRIRARGALPTAMLFLAVVIAGCQGGEPLSANGRPWSTRGESVIDAQAAAAGRPPKLSASATPTRDPLRIDASLEPIQNATDILIQASTADDPALRAHAIEGLRYSSGLLRSVGERLIGDPNRGVRFIAAITIGQAQCMEVAVLVHPLLLDNNPSVRAAGMFALSRCGESVDLSPLATMAMSEDDETRANALFVLGELRNPSARPVVEAALEHPSARANPARESVFLLQGAEALVKLGDESQLDSIRAAMFSPGERGELVGLACQMAGEIGDRGSIPMLARLMAASGNQQRPIEIRLVAATSFARLGGTPLDLAQSIALEGATSSDPVVRGQSAFALGAISTPLSRSMLSGLLADPNPEVQVAAATAILRGANALQGRSG